MKGVIIAIAILLLTSTSAFAQTKYALTLTPVADYKTLEPEAQKWDITGTHTRIVAADVQVIYVGKDSVEYAITCIPAAWFRSFDSSKAGEVSTWEAAQQVKVPSFKTVITDDPQKWLADNGYTVKK